MGMIGRWVSALANEAAQDAILTEKMCPGAYVGTHGRCLLGTAGDFMWHNDWISQAKRRGFIFRYSDPQTIEGRYDRLCCRFGAPRVNTAIRNRILSNRARLLLARESVEVGAGASEA